MKNLCDMPPASAGSRRVRRRLRRLRDGGHYGLHPEERFQVLEYDAASGQACVYDLYLYKGGYNDDGITVKLVVDPSVLDVYNVESGLELKVMPDRYFAFDPEVRLSGDRVMDRAEIRFDAAFDACRRH